ncbi:hypothetical protein GUJ93_ZPchr0005g14690 [Zizania palustris]|uniref:Peptidase A1 domain-containing protein n=1 Tax=Zizania palustris TaxID=103762 RepID=A0A8J5W1Y2_ZIZPA|nr:hypothetical protein GUJ93_ZPchr0005g14690 [Zizania palustris]
MPPGLLLLCLLQLLLLDLGDHGFRRAGAADSFHLPVSAPVVPDSAEERRLHYRALEAKDLLRHRRMTRQVPELMSNTSMFELPMRSAVNIAHVGMYIVVVRIGTPALPYSLVLDTANDLTWINCRLRRRKGKHPGRPHVKKQPPTTTTMAIDDAGEPVKVLKNWYRPALSDSWRRYRCSQKLCMDFPHNTCQGNNQTTSCTYFQELQDGTTTSGIYGQEKASVLFPNGTMAKLPGLVLGCSTFEAGGAVDSHDGVLSLGNSRIAFGFTATKRFGGRFSFCLLATASDRNTSSYLTFGSNPAVESPGTMETPLIYNVELPVAYGPHVTALLVGGVPLDIPPEVWDYGFAHGGVVLDTGTSITGLVPAAYDAVTAALDRHLAHLEKVTDVLGFDYCYNWNFTGDGVDPAHNVTIPSFAIEMDGGARLEPDAKSIVMPDVVPGVACLAFRRLVQGPAIIGNVLMQEHIWEIDHVKEMLRFRKDNCLDQNKNATSSSPPATDHAA